MLRYKVADVVFDADIKYSYTASHCEKYLYDGDEAPELTITITTEEIEYERSLTDYKAGAGYFESLALYRKLLQYVLGERDGLIFHSSAIMVDGKAYLFTAVSGTGKSTHTRLWRELLGDKAVMVNDDKPIIRIIDGKAYVYGTPWNGKHGLDNNCRAEVKAICKLTRGVENKIVKLTPKEMISTALAQTLKPKNLEEMDKLLALLDKLLKTVDLYLLSCNISLEAAKLSYETMSGDVCL